MGLVIPQSSLTLYRNVGFDSSYQHVRKFTDITEQTAFFAQRAALSVQNMTYIRQSGRIKIECNPDAIFDCDYLSFLNSGFGMKRFYAFITDIDYVNNVTAEISFNIDFYQTWQFQMSVGSCWVEREHTADDSIGANTVPEPIAYGNNIAMNTSSEASVINWNLLIQAIPDTLTTVKANWTAAGGTLTNEVNRGQAEGTIYNNIYSGAKMIICGRFETEINTAINELLANNYKIIAMYEVPANLISIADAGGGDMSPGVSRPTTFVCSGSDSYTPVNNKLFTFPYTFLRVDNLTGGVADFRWENFGGSKDFYVWASYVGAPAMAIAPKNYESGGNFDRVVTLDGFPQVTWNESALAQWQGNNAIMRLLRPFSQGTNSTAYNPLSIGMSIAARPLAQGLSTAYAEAHLVNQMRTNPTEGQSDILSQPENKGNGTSNFLLWSNYKYGFYFQQMGIRPEMARRVDQFFSRYGYQTNLYKVPNMTSRTTFNYVKCTGARASGPAPAYAIAAFEDMLNSGVTFWHSDTTPTMLSAADSMEGLPDNPIRGEVG